MPQALLESTINEEDTQRGKFLVFSLGKEDYGIEISCVIEIIGIQPITTIPNLPEYIKGIINLRGMIIPIIDARHRFNKEHRDYDDRTCIIVIDIQNLLIGLVVDRVAEVTSILEVDIAPPPQINPTGQKFIKGIGKVNSDVKLLLDCKSLLEE